MDHKKHFAVKLLGYILIVLAIVFAVLALNGIFYDSLLDYFARFSLFFLFVSFFIWFIELFMTRKINETKILFLFMYVFLAWCLVVYIPSGKSTLRQNKQKCAEYQRTLVKYILQDIADEVEEYISERGYPFTKEQFENWRSEPLPLSPFGTDIYLNVYNDADQPYYEISTYESNWGDTYFYDSKNPDIIFSEPY